MSVDDLISRQVAIAYAISGRVRTLPTTEDGENWIRVSEVRESLIAVPPAQQWIPCSERLPNHDEYIKNNGLFNVSDGDRSYSEYFDYDKQKFGEPTMTGFCADYAVIAWMPLPEPPEVDEDGTL